MLEQHSTSNKNFNDRIKMDQHPSIAPQKDTLLEKKSSSQRRLGASVAFFALALFIIFGSLMIFRAQIKTVIPSEDNFSSTNANYENELIEFTIPDGYIVEDATFPEDSTLFLIKKGDKSNANFPDVNIQIKVLNSLFDKEIKNLNTSVLSLLGRPMKPEFYDENITVVEHGLSITNKGYLAFRYFTDVNVEGFNPFFNQPFSKYYMLIETKNNILRVEGTNFSLKNDHTLLTDITALADSLTDKKQLISRENQGPLEYRKPADLNEGIELGNKVLHFGSEIQQLYGAVEAPYTVMVLGALSSVDKQVIAKELERLADVYQDLKIIYVDVPFNYDMTREPSFANVEIAQYCAGKQNLYFKMRDYTFDESYGSYREIKQLVPGLDIAAFDSCFDSPETIQELIALQREGQETLAFYNDPTLVFLIDNHWLGEYKGTIGFAVLLSLVRELTGNPEALGSEDKSTKMKADLTMLSAEIWSSYRASQDFPATLEEAGLPTTLDGATIDYTGGHEYYSLSVRLPNDNIFTTPTRP